MAEPKKSHTSTLDPTIVSLVVDLLLSDGIPAPAGGFSPFFQHIGNSLRLGFRLIRRFRGIVSDVEKRHFLVVPFPRTISFQSP